MTNEHYLEVAKECGFGTVTIYSEENKEIVLHTSTPERLAAYTARICAEKDAEIVKLHNAHVELEKSYLQRLSTANAAIAMKDEALGTLELNDYCAYEGSKRTAHLIDAALSASAESVAAWEESKLLPLQRQISVCVKALTEISTFPRYRMPADIAKEALQPNTQATAEAYERELSAKVLEGAAERMMNLYDEKVLREMAAELLAANKKEGE